MASVFKRGGKANRGGVWYAAWTDHTGKPKTKSTRTTDKGAAELIAAQYERDAALRRQGNIDVTQEALAAQTRRPLADHVAEFCETLTARQNTAKHVRMTRNQINALLASSGAKAISELTGATVTKAIAALRLPTPGNAKSKGASL